MHPLRSTRWLLTAGSYEARRSLHRPLPPGGERTRLRWLPALLLVAAVTAACGGSSSSITSSDPNAAARGFVAAVSSGDRGSWCADVGSPLDGQVLKGPLTGGLLRSCISSDLFLITGSCDVERAIAGASVAGVRRAGDLAVAKLSSGLRVEFRRAGRRWLFDGAGAAQAVRAPPVTSGPCAGG